MDAFAYLMSCLLSLFSNPVYASISFTALFLAIATALAIRHKNLSDQHRIRLTYAHLAMLLLPLAFFSQHMPCKSIGGLCGVISAFSNSVILALVSIVIIGYFFLPLIYPVLYRTKRQKNGVLFAKLEDLSARLRIRSPRLFIFDGSLPLAFSISGLMPAIFISVGMQELLRGREIDAVLLHELNHISNSAPNLRLLLKIARVFSPFYAIMNTSPILLAGERKADAFVLGVQQTSLYLNSAKGKTEVES
ncbi:MAG: hypothetical protein KGH57_03935 [Candidatus Micrarchaeota archaeon]|nr:hypothetical protein [Candidatus Micrarchaeota archaeon]